MVVGATDNGLSTFQGLAQGFENGPREFRQFIQKEHAIVSKADIPRASPQPSADQGCYAGGVVRISVWTRGYQGPFRKYTGDGVDHADLQGFVCRQGRQKARQTTGQHGLSGTRRAAHQKIMPTGCGDLQSPTCAFLAPDVGQIWQASRLCSCFRFRGSKECVAAKVIDQ